MEVGHIISAPSIPMMLQERMEHFDLLLALAKRAGVSPASLLYSLIDDQFVELSDDDEFQEDWIEVAQEMGENPKAVAFFERLLAASTQPKS